MTDTTTDIETINEPDMAPANVSPKEVLRTVLERNAAAVGASLPSGFSQDRFVRLLLTAANTNPELFECDPTSFLAAGVGAAQLGLEPNDARGLAYLIPFRDRRRGRVVQLIIGYRGMLDLARRSGQVTAVHVHPVFEQDTFTYKLGLEPTLEHLPAGGDENPDDLTHVYAVAKIGGDSQFVVMNRPQLESLRKQFGRSKMSPWHTHFVEMCKKSAIRRLCKLLPQTVETAMAADYDERELVLGDLGGLTAIDPAVDEVIDLEEHDDGTDG